MSDAIDAVAEAVARTKRLAARHLVRKEELEAEIAQLRRDREGVEDAALAQEIDARLATATRDLAAASQELQAALDEIKELQRLAGQARTAEARQTVAAAVTSDPLIRSPEEIALDNVRQHVADLEAQARLGDELGTPAPAAPPPAPEDAEAAARREFEALREKRLRPDGDDPPASGDTEPPRPKKTL